MIILINIIIIIIIITIIIITIIIAMNLRYIVYRIYCRPCFRVPLVCRARP